MRAVSRFNFASTNPVLRRSRLTFTPCSRSLKRRLLVRSAYFPRPQPKTRVRADYASHPIEFITELPRTKQARGGGGGARRRRPYGDIGITMVDEGYLPPAAAFRDAGNKSLFRFERRSTCGENGVEGSADAIVEATLRSAGVSNDDAATAVSRSAAKAAASGARDFTFLTAVDGQEEERGGGDAAEADRLLGHEPGGPGGMSTRLLRGPVDPMVRGDPVKLRMALTALRYTLKHPVTSSMDVPRQQQPPPHHQNSLAGRNRKNGFKARGSNNNWTKDKDSGVGRKTAAARARQLPRRPYRLLKGPHQPSFCARLLDGAAREGGGEGLDRVDEVSRTTVQGRARCAASTLAALCVTVFKSVDEDEGRLCAASHDNSRIQQCLQHMYR